MRRFRPGASLFVAALILTHVAITPPTPARAGVRPSSASNPFCERLGKKTLASQGAQMYCFGPKGAPEQGSGPSSQPSTKGSGSSKPINVNAADPKEDVSPSGARAYGQSETSIAAAGPYVVEAWNDSTAFFSPPCSPMNKDQLTGFGFSNDGGRTFADLGGLPNARCDKSVMVGDPSVEAYLAGGKTYFYISSILIPFDIPENEVSVTACQVVGTGIHATLHCASPIVAAISSDCETFEDGEGSFKYCGFLDKEYLAIDQARGRLYMSYTEFGVNEPKFNGIIELAVCRLTNPMVPSCSNGLAGHQTNPYMVVAPAHPTCEQEGAYPAVDPLTGDVFVAYEFNIGSNIFDSRCAHLPTKEVVKRIPQSCLGFPHALCSSPANSRSINIVSMDAAFIPGYSRFPMNDFPRIAVDRVTGTVSIVWNDARWSMLGDILLQSMSLSNLTLVQPGPVRLNAKMGGAHFLPAVRNADSRGRLNVAWYDRSDPNSAVTEVRGAFGIDPRLTAPPRSNVRLTDRASNWNAVSSDIDPNFGDYIDTYVVATSTYPYTGRKVAVAWADGRLGTPQPFATSTG